MASSYEPWLALFAPFVSIEDRPHAQCTSRFLLRACSWLRVYVPAPSSETIAAAADAVAAASEAQRLQSIRQALHLLSKLAHTDIHAFRQLVVGGFGFRSESVESVAYTGQEDGAHEDDEGLQARFAFQFDGDSIAEDVRWPETLCTQLFFSDAVELSAGEESMERHNGSADPVCKVATVPICLDFKPLGIGHDDLVDFLLSVVRIVRSFQAQHAHRQPTGNGSSTQSIIFLLESVRLHLNSFEMTTQVAGILTTLVGLGVIISALTVRVRESDITAGWCSLLAQGTLFRAITGGSGATPVAVQSLTIQGPNVGVAQFAALSSGLAVSSYVPSLNLFSVFDDTSRANRAAKWRWLAYALFSRDAKISVDKLGINGQWMLLEDVEAMIAVMESHHPLQELLASDTAVVEGTRRKAHLLKDTLVRLTPPDIGEDGGGDEDWAIDALSLDRDNQFSIVEDYLSSSCLGILVPGFGECWVDRAAVLKITSDELTTTLLSSSQSSTSTARVHSRQVTSFAISIDFDEDGSFLALRRLLSAIGAPLLSLEVFQAYGFAFECLRDLLHSCLQLRNLYIEGIRLCNGDLDELIELYETRQCSLSSLTLEDYQFESSKTLTSLANALSHSSKRIASTIRELCIGESTEDIAMDEANVQAFLSMLQVNKTLLYLELHLPVPLHISFASAFAKSNNQYLPVEKRKLPLRSRLALLSISALDRFSLVGRIEQHVLARVFAFAAVAETRRIVLRDLPQ